MGQPTSAYGHLQEMNGATHVLEGLFFSLPPLSSLLFFPLSSVLLLFPSSSSSSPLSLPLSPLLVAPLERGGHGVTSMLAACPAMLVNRRPCLSLGVALFVFTFPLDTNETGRSREWGSVSFVGKVKKTEQAYRRTCEGHGCPSSRALSTCIGAWREGVCPAHSWARAPETPARSPTQNLAVTRENTHVSRG